MAGHLGRTVGQLDTMSAREFASWIAFDQLSPIGGERLDCLFATFKALLANCHSKKRFRPQQFLPKWGREAKGSSPASIKAYFQALKQRQDEQRAKLEAHKRQMADENAKAIAAGALPDG